jgi:squalene-hopene/tetraprenyl-beta-curcumene cyclase
VEADLREAANPAFICSGRGSFRGLISSAAIADFHAAARGHLLDQRTAAGHWEGALSPSALSTATAITALALIDREGHAARIARGVRWLEETQNADGGHGDTTMSFSNVSTTVLVWAALGLCGPEGAAAARSARWIEAACGSLEPAVLAEKIAARYGRDRTFSVPILMMAALGGRLGPPEEAWRRVLPLPFELAAVPRRWYAAMRMPVVSYALPALIAIGQARFRQAPPPAPWRWVREAASLGTLKLLREIQPATGGYLEATPLTSFVAMALASSGQREHPVVAEATRFLLGSQLADGSWAIDTNLATWTTTLAVKALGPSCPGAEGLREWLLGQQYQGRHPYTDAAPGGWAWTDLAGGVPDADDTPGALLALAELGPDPRVVGAAAAGCGWLRGLQNRDGGVPTFCRGWGALPFDRSSPDLTAHTLRAWSVWRSRLPAAEAARLGPAMAAARRYLAATQAGDGSWTPLWFGNQHRADEANPTYGTATVAQALDPGDPMRQRAGDWLRAQQNADGGWGGGGGTPSSIEETALAVAALASASPAAASLDAGDPVGRGVRWLIDRTGNGRHFPPSPIGFYFAKLWYWEKLYPVVWTVSALRAVAEGTGRGLER